MRDESRGRVRARWPIPRSQPTLATAARSWGRKGAYQDFWSSDSPALRSPFKRPPARITDLDTGHLDRRTVGRRHCLALRRCKAFVDEAGDHVAVEFIGEHKQVLYDAVRSAGKQRECTALFPAEAWFSWGRHHASRGT